MRDTSGGNLRAVRSVGRRLGDAADGHLRRAAQESFSYWTARNGLVEVGTTVVQFDRDPADGTSIRIHETASRASS